MGLNVCKTVGDEAVFFCTYRLYTWCFFVFVFSLFCLTLLLFAYTPKQKKVPNWLKYGATGLFTTVILLCAISALYHRGIAF
jgi:hypothetical protein